MIRLFRAKQVDGLIIAPTVRSGEEIRRLVDESFPFVVFDRRFPKLDTHCVLIDNKRSSYALVSDPLPAALLGGLLDSLVWESARPYLYLRTTPDRRLLVGGEDDAIDVPACRNARNHRTAASVGAIVRFPAAALNHDSRDSPAWR